MFSPMIIEFNRCAICEQCMACYICWASSIPIAITHTMSLDSLLGIMEPV